MEFINNSLLARMGWKLHSKESLLWVEVLRGKYLPNDLFFGCSSRSSIFLDLERLVLKNRNELEKGACWSVSMGDKIHVWNSSWIPLMPYFKPRPNVNLVDLPEFLVADLLTG